MRVLSLIAVVYLTVFPVFAQRVNGGAGSSGNALVRVNSSTVPNPNFNGNQFSANGSNVSIKNGATTTNLTETSTLTVGAPGTQGSTAWGDADGSNTYRITPAAVTTTDINSIKAAAPIQGLHATDVSGLTNETDRASIPADFRTASGTHASPTTTNPLSPTWTTPLMVVWYGATGTINLPAVANYAGAAILVYNTGAFTITIDSNGSEVIVRDGTVQTGGVSITLSSGAGNYVFVYCDGARWITLGYKGTLAQGS